jgi:hypothetical protein
MNGALFHGTYLTSRTPRSSSHANKDMNITEGATAQNFRYVEFAPRPSLPLIEEPAHA